jgi:hypothetical protein
MLKRWSHINPFLGVSSKFKNIRCLLRNNCKLNRMLHQTNSHLRWKSFLYITIIIRLINTWTAGAENSVPQKFPQRLWLYRFRWKVVCKLLSTHAICLKKFPHTFAIRILLQDRSLLYRLCTKFIDRANICDTGPWLQKLNDGNHQLELAPTSIKQVPADNVGSRFTSMHFIW